MPAKPKAGRTLRPLDHLPYDPWNARPFESKAETAKRRQTAFVAALAEEDKALVGAWPPMPDGPIDVDGPF